MSQFPVLNTGAVAQYPADRGIAHSTDILPFVDGLEQRSRRFGQSMRRWTIRLEMVDEGELAAIDAFFAGQQGAAGSFAFTDPWDGTVYPDCSIESDELRVALSGPGKGRTQIVIQENRT